ncbi:hypothetical protein LTR56_026817 [Elasticomyces elasticus]|nr:hypothetical protein LTR56_026817 [Elasticomyces elasticus]KAK3617801.1 hypothetical protein LTR22_026609 [Elasticomyces elasticus]KAK4903578.1 hypothetical protein LTR49_026802 [Elasticomyces elasticus]
MKKQAQIAAEGWVKVENEEEDGVVEVYEAGEMADDKMTSNECGLIEAEEVGKTKEDDGEMIEVENGEMTYHDGKMVDMDNLDGYSS